MNENLHVVHTRPRRLWKLIAGIGIVALLLMGGALGFLSAQRTAEKRHYQAANDFYAQGEWDQAIAEYTEALATQPDFVRQHTDLAYANRGAAYFHQREYESAIADLDQALYAKSKPS